MVTVKIYITEQMKAQLQTEAKDKTISIAAVVRQRLTKSYESEEQQFYQSNYKRQENNDRSI